MEDNHDLVFVLSDAEEKRMRDVSWKFLPAYLIDINHH